MGLLSLEGDHPLSKNPTCVLVYHTDLYQ